MKRRLRQEFADAVKSGELDFSEIIEITGPAGRTTAGEPHRYGSQLDWHRP